MVRIITDSAADFEHSESEKFGISTVPLAVYIDGKEYKDAIMEEIGSLVDSIGEEGDIEIGDTVVVIGVDKDDNVVSYSMKINLKMNIEGIATDATVDMDMKFNAVGDDFKIGAPADAASYIDSTELDY